MVRLTETGQEKPVGAVKGRLFEDYSSCTGICGTVKHITVSRKIFSRENFAKASAIEIILPDFFTHGKSSKIWTQCILCGGCYRPITLLKTPTVMLLALQEGQEDLSGERECRMHA